MEISRLIFSKETKKKMDKSLNALELGKLRFNRLKELQEDGKLGYAKNRYELAKLLGFTDQQKKKGYQWVSNNIRRQHVIERVVGINKKGKMEFEYSVGSEPDFDRKNANKARWEKSEKNKETKSIKKSAEPSSLDNLTNRQKGKILYTRLMKLSNDNGGELKDLTSRGAVAKAVGGKIGWVSGLIGRGYLKETLDYYYGDRAMFKYELTDKIPDYEYTKSGNKIPKCVEEPKPIEEPVIINRAEPIENAETSPVYDNSQIETSTEVVENAPIKIEITKGDVVIRVEFNDNNQASELITTILKGE